MATFNFLGTFNRAQFGRLVAFVRPQMSQIDRRLQHLNAELNRVGRVEFQYDPETKEPTAYVAEPEGSYLYRLVACYEVLGGNPFIDLRTRSTAQAVFIRKGDETVSPTTLSNGEALPGKGLSDGPSGELVRRMKEWTEVILERRFGRLERRIRRTLDYADQLEAEIALLETARSSPTRGFEKTVQDLEQLLNDPNYRAITPDSDPFGFLTYAPYSSYDVAQSSTDDGQPIDPNQLVEREATVPQRQDGVIIKPGQKST